MRRARRISGTAQNGVYIGLALNAGGSNGNQIGGPTAAERNILSGNNAYGLLLDSGTSGNLVQGNYIGTNASGSGAIGNTLGGIRISSPDAVIGGPAAGAGNLISGNGGVNAVGIEIQGGTGATIVGNRIGPNALGTGTLPNGIGISINGSNTDVGGLQPGEGNVISASMGAGVRVTAGTGNTILGNSITGNVGLGIDLGTAGVTANDSGDVDTGANNLQNFPVLSTPVAGGVQGTLNSTPNTTFTIQFFGNSACDSSGNGEGQTLLGSTSVTTSATGNATIPVFNATTGQVVTATATSSPNDTSEFSACVTVPLAAGDVHGQQYRRLRPGVTPPGDHRLERQVFARYHRLQHPGRRAALDRAADAAADHQ